MIIDKNLRDMILFIYHHLHNLSSGSGGGGNVTTSQLNTALADKVDKGGYTGTAQDLKNAIDTVDSKTIHWNDIQNKPELDFIPTSWNKKNGGTIIDTSGEDWLEINAEDFSNEGVSFGKSSLRTTAHYEAVDRDDNNKSTRVAPGFILFNRDAAIRKEIGNTIAFDDFNLSNEYVYVRIAGVKIGDNSTGNRLLLDNGGTKSLTDFATSNSLSEVNDKISNLKIGGRNLALNSKVNVTNNSYGILSFLLSEEPKVGEQLTITLKGVLGAGKESFELYNKSGSQELCILQNKGNGIYQSTFNWLSDPVNPKLLVIYVINSSVVVNSTVEWIKLERGNTATDWTPAPEDYDFIKPGFLTSELNTFKNRKTGGYYVNDGVNGSGILLSFEAGGSTSSLEFYKPNWYPETRIQVRNTVDGNRFNGDNGGFRELAWLSDIARAGGDISGNWTANKFWQNGFIFVRNACNIELNQLDNMGSIFFRKVFVGGNITFTCAGKTIIYTNGSAFNGGDGSTATVSIFENKCYIDIKNV
jgi:hypothetical protein